MSKSSLFCYLCGKPIKFDNEHISERTGKKIPLDEETSEPHDCPVRSQRQQRQSQQEQPKKLDNQFSEQPAEKQQQQRRYHQCNKGCGQEIYFDPDNKSQSGKWIPLSKDTGQPHQCQ